MFSCASWSSSVLLFLFMCRSFSCIVLILYRITQPENVHSDDWGEKWGSFISWACLPFLFGPTYQVRAQSARNQIKWTRVKNWGVEQEKNKKLRRESGRIVEHDTTIPLIEKKRERVCEKKERTRRWRMEGSWEQRWGTRMKGASNGLCASSP